MTRRYLRILLVGSLLSLTACAPQSEVRQMHQSISTLNKEMTQLNQETVKITQQNKLNAESTRGVYCCLAPIRLPGWRVRSVRYV
ncbi:lipoprotein [Salmonella enterica subsp. enterica]|uniref:Lipoprotein n=1 Tax=Salmonella enterica I TaxID=59201 RepID=A0A379WDK4_SALET|nr:lipoprotein [Salmonella enterica subsp. enterica]